MHMQIHMPQGDMHMVAAQRRLNFTMAEITLIDFLYLNRLDLSTFTEVGPSFQIKIQGWGQS